jgi:hypothetical protein
MTTQPAIPIEIQAEVQKLVDEFNRKHFNQVDFRLHTNLNVRSHHSGYSARFKGKFLYLDRSDGAMLSPICRLTWFGAMDKWEFAIYKYSDGHYDPDEWFFPGIEKVDGTVTGAMEAGMEAYPIQRKKLSDYPPFRFAMVSRPGWVTIASLYCLFSSCLKAML